MNPARSLRIVLASVGSRGDVQPMLALAQVLAARGHVPVLAAPANFETWVRSLGFEFAPLGDDVQVFLAENRHIMTGKPLRMLKEMVRYFKEQIPLQAQQLAPVCQGADLVVYAGLAFAAPSVAEHLGMPALGVLYTTCLLPASQHPPPNIPWHGLPAWVNRLLWHVNRVLGDLLLRSTLNTMRQSLGLPPVDHLRRHLIKDQALIIAADQVLFPPDPLWQGRYGYANFIFFDDPAPLDPQLEAWLNEGDAPIYIGFGSMLGQGIERVERMIVEAVSATGRRCIVDAGWAGLGAGEPPRGWHKVRNAPHALLFPHCAAVVHHGGSGTTAQALRAGVPQVLLPLILDQFHHAHRLFLAGIAPRPVAMEKITAAELTTAIESALQLPAGPRLAAAARLTASDGRAGIVRQVEALCAYPVGKT
jgi:UDP:flavonoid glycosyltransferase YjiC (YdhE family)